MIFENSIVCTDGFDFHITLILMVGVTIELLSNY
jgi:hypothetical protein